MGVQKVKFTYSEMQESYVCRPVSHTYETLTSYKPQNRPLQEHLCSEECPGVQGVLRRVGTGEGAAAWLESGLASLWLLVPRCLLTSRSVVCDHAGCSQNTNRTCEECLKNVSCLWCNTDKACLDYPVTKILPPSSLCKLSSARWGVCWVNFEALIIALSVLGGALLLGVACCCYCCCCGRRRSRRPDKSEERAAREREERRVRQEERRAEMKSRHDEIRKKYGLFREENPYARFENN
ncbi:PREDICTED: pituitary tumor-transforming gene 1 protein-interacting protein [Lipotes vexillifer]|uniref:Pituitary tumor-transforming gene 1 protein-interacting protein n=1 Tax=Lipotes vexillifer TaxID=118797 RepID=A0A340X0C5_LIPVE|nr:PREDICTED: pituitary tumor-transforming gene 1 protein-interacting protein [Lipotes vexillifer]